MGFPFQVRNAYSFPKKRMLDKERRIGATGEAGARRGNQP